MTTRRSFRQSRVVGFAFITLAVAELLFGCGLGRDRKLQILQRADRYFLNRDYEKAKIEYLNLLKLERNNPHAIQQLGLIWS